MHLAAGFVKNMFVGKKFEDGIGKAAAANASFSEDVMRAIKNRMDTPRDSGCTYYRCSFHHSHWKELPL
jgi:hypothetical protein